MQSGEAVRDRDTGLDLWGALADVGLDRGRVWHPIRSKLQGDAMHLVDEAEMAMLVHQLTVPDSWVVGAALQDPVTSEPGLTPRRASRLTASEQA